MSYAVTPDFNDSLSKLIIVDIAPSAGSISEDFKELRRFDGRDGAEPPRHFEKGCRDFYQRPRSGE